VLLRELGLEVRVEAGRPGEGLTRVRAREPGQAAWAALTWYSTGGFAAHGRADAAAYARGPLELHGLCPPSALSAPGGPYGPSPSLATPAPRA
jgi:hypothetical protein